MTEVLIVDDERALAQSLSARLEVAGYSVRLASGGEAALAAVRERRPDLVLLDIMMPGMDGETVCRRLREVDRDLLVVFLTALSSPEDEVRALAAGGDSFISKTVSDDVLLARLSALLRLRSQEAEDGGDFDFGSWRVEGGKLRMVRLSGRVEPLMEREIAFLRLLARNPGTVFSREAILVKLWGIETEVSDNALSSFVYALRKKLGRDGVYLASVRGTGYAYRHGATHATTAV